MGFQPIVSMISNIIREHFFAHVLFGIDATTGHKVHRSSLISGNGARRAEIPANPSQRSWKGLTGSYFNSIVIVAEIELRGLKGRVRKSKQKYETK